MKKRKLSCLLALITCLTLPLAACKDDESGTSMNKYFHWESARTAYSQVKRYDGELVTTGDNEDALNDHNIAVIRSTKNLASGEAQTAYEVVDLSTDVTILTRTNATDTTYTVEVTYPVIKVTKNYQTAYMDEPELTYSYYLAKNEQNYSGSNAVVEGLKDNANVSVKERYSLYQVTLSGYREYWISEDLEILRSFNVAQTSGTSINNSTFKAAYNNYLYAWNMGTIQVYNLAGECSMQYTSPTNVAIFMVGSGQLNVGAPYVLDNGNIILQEHVPVDADATEYTYKMETADPETMEMISNKYDVTTKIIDYKTGEVQEIEVDYIICDLQAAYVENAGNFPAKVREEYQNQAYIAKIENQEVRAVDYVTLDCSGAVTHTVENEWVRLQSTFSQAAQGACAWSNISFDKNGNYAVSLLADGQYQMWQFNEEGEKIAAFRQFLVSAIKGGTDEYLITEYGIYNYDGECLYDFTTSEFLKSNSYLSFEYERLTVDDFVAMKDKISIGVVNVLTQEYEYFEFNGEDFEKVEGAVTIDANDDDLPQGNTATIAVPSGKSMGVAGVNTVTWTLYDAEGDPLLKMQVEYGSAAEVLRVCEDVAYVETKIDGKPIVYVVK